MRRHQSIRMILARIAYIALPAPIFYWILHFIQRQKPRTSLSTASDHRKISAQKGVDLWIYWSDVPGAGSGPSASLFVMREEVLRLDCFGGREGHMHLNPEQQRYTARITARLYFSEGNRAEHVDRAVFELLINTDAALKSNRLARVRKFPIDWTALAYTAQQARLAMLELLERHCVGNRT